ncbi:hypothetical protein KUDE01_025130 [Dissostichus eleginoides]|uniref:Uncharacterized protein n=1 Tax=Dissostichus eleginoides TaxID=100907 RepID=A0AAD9BDQ7_DISEL|nr:hypothetical protein KUDE01_025130 [Dissostichus eleginoides]
MAATGDSSGSSVRKRHVEAETRSLRGRKAGRNMEKNREKNRRKTGDHRAYIRGLSGSHVLCSCALSPVFTWWRSALPSTRTSS